jgi:exopolyphosphatase/guanosine-5'-triphosphate,3'-diphosphate pyrophosphatase
MADSQPRVGGDTGEVMAAVDLGSNSFHMVVARSQHGEPSIVDRLREMVRLASGLNAEGFLHRARRAGAGA